MNFVLLRLTPTAHCGSPPAGRESGPICRFGGSGEVFPSNLLSFLGQIWINAIGIEGLRISPLNLSGLRINLETRFLPDFEPLFHVRFLNHCMYLHGCWRSFDG